MALPPARAARTLDSKAAFLRSLPAFCGLRDRDLSRLASLFDEVGVDSGEVLIREGAPGRELFVIVDGLALVSLRDKAVATVGAGELLGEMSLLERGPCSATVTALTPMRTLVAGAASFGSLVGRPVVLRLLATTLARRLRTSQGSPAGWDRAGSEGMAASSLPPTG